MVMLPRRGRMRPARVMLNVVDACSRPVWMRVSPVAGMVKSVNFVPEMTSRLVTVIMSGISVSVSIYDHLLPDVCALMCHLLFTPR